MINLTIDGNLVTVPKGTTVYTAAQQLGIDIPIFCYIDRMPPFGACRMCLVEIEKSGKLQTSCTLEATEGMVVKTQSAMALEGREGIIEFLLLNHPLDCPICDRGGECPLQEHALHHGPGESRFFEDKRHFKKPLPLGPVLTLDRERCIVCARCTRFGDLLAGDHALEFLDRGYKVEVGTPDGGPAESKFIGNTIMICPVGALTSSVYRFRARPWDNHPTNSTCTLCPVGCSLILDSRDGEIMRTRSRENRDVNDIWLCDKGWFGYEFTYNPDRLQYPLVRRSGKLVETSWDEALSLVAEKIHAAIPKGKLAALGGNPLTVEENYLLQKLMRNGLGVHNLDYRVGMPIVPIDEEGMPPGMEMSIGDCEQLSYAVLLGFDLTEEFPVIWLRLRQAINRGAIVIFIGHYLPEIAPHLSQTVLHAPGKELEVMHQHLSDLSALASDGKKGALFVGRQYLNSPRRQSILSQLKAIQQGIPNLSLNVMEGRGNSFGARFAGMHPEIGPNGERVERPGLNALQVIEEAANGGWNFLYVVGANPAKKFPSKLWDQARSKCEFMVVQDLFLTETAQQADLVLPSLSFVEKGGNFINLEGRVQRLLPGKGIPEGLYSDAEIFTQIAAKLDIPLALDMEFLEKLKQDKVLSHRTSNLQTSIETPKELKNGMLRATFAPALFDEGVRMKHDPHVIQLAKPPRVRIHPIEGERRNLRSGDIVRLTANNSSITAKIHLDKGVAEGTAVLPLGFDEIPVNELGTRLMNGMGIDIAFESRETSASKLKLVM